MKLIITIERSKEVPHFGYVREIERKVNEQLELKEFGGGLEGGFLFVLRSFSPERNAGEIFKPVRIYRAKKKEVSISCILPFETTVTENRDEILRLTCECLLKSILIFKDLNIKEFDIEQYYQEVYKIMTDNNWLSSSASAGM